MTHSGKPQFHGKPRFSDEDLRPRNPEPVYCPHEQPAQSVEPNIVYQYSEEPRKQGSSAFVAWTLVVLLGITLLWQFNANLDDTRAHNRQLYKNQNLIDERDQLSRQVIELQRMLDSTKDDLEIERKRSKRRDELYSRPYTSPYSSRYGDGK